VRLHRDPEHVAEHRYTDLKPDPGEKSDQYRASEEIGQESELKEPRQQQKSGGQIGATANLDSFCAHRPQRCAGRDEETDFEPTKEKDARPWQIP
jgi:hypothetical protein